MPHTFSAHPLGCAAALAGLELLNSPEIKAKEKSLPKIHEQFTSQIKNHPKVQSVRCKGVILAIDLNVAMERYGNLRDELYQFFIDRGVALRPLGHTVYILPPYVITEKQLQKIYNTIEEALAIA